MRPFCRLADPSSYVACPEDLATDAAAREYWVELFKRHVNTLLEMGVAAEVARGAEAGAVAARADACRDRLYAKFDRFKESPGGQGRVTILTLDAWRDRLVREAGFDDPFVDLKNRENERMLPLLPEVCREIDALVGEDRLRAVVEGVFAGNIFDMGSEVTAKQFLGKSVDFFATRGKICPRPWLVDDFNLLVERLVLGEPHRKAVFFIDNAGSDFLLGALPMMRWMGQRGTRVVLAANERPTLNDMTVHDVRAWWPRVVETEPSIGALPIEIVSTGTGEPLIDLSAVSDELNRAAADADFVILEGMGRGVESNFEARFDCDALNIAMVKDKWVAQRLGGKVYDVVCRFH
jgi:type II pantothenate kinase